MHTVFVLAGGFALLGLCLLVGSARHGRAGLLPATSWFVATWFAGAAANLYVGVRAGYTVREELPMFGLVFLVPVSAAVAARWLLR